MTVPMPVPVPMPVDGQRVVLEDRAGEGVVVRGVPVAAQLDETRLPFRELEVSPLPRGAQLGELNDVLHLQMHARQKHASMC